MSGGRAVPLIKLRRVAGHGQVRKSSPSLTYRVMWNRLNELDPTAIGRLSGLALLVAAVAAGVWWGFRKSAELGRRILAGVGLAVLAIVVLTAVLNRPHPLGEISIESVALPGSDPRISNPRWCHDDFPGYSASGVAPMDLDDAVEWYSDRLGPNDSTVAARPAFEDREVLEFDQVAVWLIAQDDGTSWYAVSTYPTVGYGCPYDGDEIWPGEPVDAWSRPGLCGGELIHFRGEDYETSQNPDREPPEGWQRAYYANGRQIAYSNDQFGRIFATGADGIWRRYRTRDVCGDG